MSIEVLKKELVKLSKEDQVQLMHFMLEILTQEDFEITDAWKIELERREKALASGKSEGKMVREVIKKYKSL